MRTAFLRLAALALALSLAAPARSATILIVNNDGPGEGFNDTTPVAPVGGNPGVTLGAQRLNLFNHAAAIWGAILDSPVTILVRAQMNPQTCTPTSAVLGSAGPVTIHANFAGSLIGNAWYHQALANKLATADLDGTNPDINATFNSDVDNPVCLGTRSWYYGFDHNEGNDIDFLPVLLHEMGHGLGFSTTTSSTSGNYTSGLPGVWDHFLKDKTTGLLWKDMTATQRQASAVNTGNLVWSGPAVTFKAPLVLANAGELLVTAPGGIAGSYEGGLATFGAPITGPGLSGQVVLVDDGVAPTGEGCETPFVNAAAVSGRIALIDRGTCAFTVKAANAQAAGAIGVIIANNTTGPAAPGGVDPSITIPVLGISQADGNTLKANLGAGVQVTLRLSPTQRAGTHLGGEMRMYSPNPVQSGSSVSHFDVTATPNLLMEPAINSDLTSDIDLTRELFEDIGWFPRTTGVPESTAALLALAAGPNPTRSPVTLRFALARESAVDLRVLDVAGREVAQLHRGRLAAGSHSMAWEANVAPGVYRVQLRAEGATSVRTLVRLD